MLELLQQSNRHLVTNGHFIHTDQSFKYLELLQQSNLMWHMMCHLMLSEVVRPFRLTHIRVEGLGFVVCEKSLNNVHCSVLEAVGSDSCFTVSIFSSIEAWIGLHGERISVGNGRGFGKEQASGVVTLQTLP